MVYRVSLLPSCLKAHSLLVALGMSAITTLYSSMVTLESLVTSSILETWS